MDDKTTTLLQEELDPALIKQRQGQPYIEGHTVISQANRIFGFDGWSYDLVGAPELQRIENVNAQTGEVKYSYAYSAIVRVTVGNAARTDAGFHPVQPNKQGVYTVDAHDTAYKAAVTDGLKRALRSFGAQFGNDLYGGNGGKQQPSRNGQAPAKATPQNGNGQPPVAVATTAQMKKIHAMGRAEFGEAWDEVREQGFARYTGGEKRPLAKEEASQIIDNLEARAAERETAPMEDEVSFD